MPKHVHEGIVLYNIELNGCLNGVYTNENVKKGGEIFNEIARIKEYKGDDPYTGLYDCFYFDYNNERVNALLEITKLSGAYYFKWSSLKGIQLFKGIGFKMNEKQIVVHYTD